MTNKQTGRVWFITGSSSGFGRLLAEQVLAAGEFVVATARDLAKVSDLERKYPDNAKAIRLDVTDKTQADEAVAQALAVFGRIDVLVNNAGYGLVAAQEEATEEEIQSQIDTNVYGVIHVTRAVLPHMRTQRSGHIVNMSSVAGLVGTPGLGYYNLTKFALEGMSEALAQEVAPRGIRVNAIAPGAIRTPINTAAWQTPEAYKRLMTLVPYGRIGEPEDIARAAVWLASDDSDYVVGTTLFVDGGMTLYPGFADKG